jgi:hypothetical protein
MKRFATLVVLFFSLCPAFAQSVHYVKYFDTQALIYSQYGAVNGCGVRLMGIAETFDQTVDMSVTLSRRERGVFGIIKAVSFDLTVRPGQDPLLTAVPVRNGWMRPQDGKASSPLGEISKGEDRGSILYSIAPDNAAALLGAILRKEEFLTGVAREGSAFERVYRGPIKLSDRDADQISRCMSELLR